MVGEQDFRSFLSSLDFLFLSETHLARNDNVDALYIPGYILYTQSRPYDEPSRDPFGGVACYVREQLGVTRMLDHDGPDRIVFECGGIRLIGQYIQPVNSRIPWQRWTDMDPYESFEACLHAADEDGMPMLVGGDLNLRIGTLMPDVGRDLLPGVWRSSDDETVSTRGRSYLRLCSDLSLVPLNGLQSIPGNHHSCTYSKGDRQSVIDYVTASVHAIPFVQALQVGPAPLPGSDHVPLVLVVDSPLPVERNSSEAVRITVRN
jgi:exonuclease III